MTAVKKLLGKQSAAGGSFNPQTDITWHSLFWAEGTAFAALGYADTNSLTSWPNETAESDASIIGGTAPTYDASHASFNSQPVVAFGNNGKVTTGAFSSAPSYPNVTMIIIAKADETTGGSYCDGTSAGFRNEVNLNGGFYGVFAGGTAQVGSVAADSSAHMLRAVFDGSTGNDLLLVDEASAVNANAGSNSITAFVIGSNRTTNYLSGQIALVGIYEGDITADGEWANFKSWSETHYGLTIA